MSELHQAVSTVVERGLRLRAGETVSSSPTPTARRSARRCWRWPSPGGDAVLTILPPNRHGTEPLAGPAAFAEADVFLAPCLPSLSHTSARKRAGELGHRGATLPGVTADMLARLMSTDFDALTTRCRAVAALTNDSDETWMTCLHAPTCRSTSPGAPRSPTRAPSAPRAFGNRPARASCRPSAARARSPRRHSGSSASPRRRSC